MRGFRRLVLGPELANGSACPRRLGRFQDDCPYLTPHRLAQGKRCIQSNVITATIQRGGHGEESFTYLKLRFGGLSKTSPRDRKQQQQTEKK